MFLTLSLINNVNWHISVRSEVLEEGKGFTGRIQLEPSKEENSECHSNDSTGGP